MPSSKLGFETMSITVKFTLPPGSVGSYTDLHLCDHWTSRVDDGETRMFVGVYSRKGEHASMLHCHPRLYLGLYPGVYLISTLCFAHHSPRRVLLAQLPGERRVRQQDRRAAGRDARQQS